jgi:flagellar biosynthesis chaperone FliJ
MTNPTDLIYPTIDLFLYDLKVGLGDEEPKIDENRRQFSQKIYGDQLTNKHLEQFKQAEIESSDYIDLLGSPNYKKFEPPLDGYFYPVQLGDMYGLQVNCTANFIQDYKFSPQPIANLSKIQPEIKTKIDADNLKPKLGQTWLIWGQLAADNQDILATAKECYAGLNLPAMPNWDENKLVINQGKFLDGIVFNLRYFPPQCQQIDDGYHVLIILFPYNLKIDASRDNVSQLYPQLIRLFAYRHKILWAYAQSRSLKSNLKQVAQSVQTTILDLNQTVASGKLNINKLPKNLEKPPNIMLKYTNNLNSLDDQGRTIKVNVGNYHKRMEKIKKLDSNSDWEFWQEFGEFTKEKFLEQIESDYVNLSPGLRLMENTIQTIQGVIDIEKTKSERILNQTVGIVGVGLATSQIARAVILTQDKPNPEVALNYRIEVFGLSLGIGFLAAMVAFIILRFWRRG